LEAVFAAWLRGGSVTLRKGPEWAPIGDSLEGKGCSRAMRGDWSRAARSSRLAGGRESAAAGELPEAEGAGWPGNGLAQPEKSAAWSAAGSKPAVSGSLLWTTPARQAAPREARSTLWAGGNPRSAPRCAITLGKRGYRGEVVRCVREKVGNRSDDFRRFFELRNARSVELETFLVLVRRARLEVEHGERKVRRSRGDLWTAKHEGGGGKVNVHGECLRCCYSRNRHLEEKVDWRLV
jgi:hypothetical protein